VDTRRATIGRERSNGVANKNRNGGGRRNRKMRGASSSSEKNRSGNRDLGHTSATVDIRLGTRRILGRVGKSNDDESRSRKSGSERRVADDESSSRKSESASRLADDESSSRKTGSASRLADDESSSRKSGSESRLANNVKMHEGRTKLKTWTSTPKFCSAMSTTPPCLTKPSSLRKTRILSLAFLGRYFRAPMAQC
jgi:hypothetical protein